MEGAANQRKHRIAPPCYITGNVPAGAQRCGQMALVRRNRHCRLCSEIESATRAPRDGPDQISGTHQWCNWYGSGSLHGGRVQPTKADVSIIKESRSRTCAGCGHRRSDSIKIGASRRLSAKLHPVPVHQLFDCYRSYNEDRASRLTHSERQRERERQR